MTPSQLDPFTLRWVAEFVRMDHPLGDTDADAGVFTAHQFIHGYLTALADEIQRGDGPGSLNDLGVIRRPLEPLPE